MLLAVAFGGQLDGTALRDVLARSREEHRDRSRAYEQLDRHLSAQPGGEPWARATLSFGRLYEDAVLRWFDTLPDEVRPGP